MLFHFLVFSFHTDVTLHVCREERGGYEGKLFLFNGGLSFKTQSRKTRFVSCSLVLSHTVGSCFTSWFLKTH